MGTRGNASRFPTQGFLGREAIGSTFVSVCWSFSPADFLVGAFHVMLFEVMRLDCVRRCSLSFESCWQGEFSTACKKNAVIY